MCICELDLVEVLWNGLYEKLLIIKTQCYREKIIWMLETVDCIEDITNCISKHDGFSRGSIMAAKNKILIPKYSLLF